MKRKGPPPFLRGGGAERFVLPSARQKRKQKLLMVGVCMYRAPHPVMITKLYQAMATFQALFPWYDLALRTIPASAVWWARGQLLKQFIELGDECTHLFMPDDDMDWPEGTDGFSAIAHLLSRQKDMIGGLGFKRMMPTLPYVGRAMANGQCQNILDLETLDSGQPFPVDFIGFGMVLISRATAIAALEEAGGNYDAVFGTEFAWATGDDTVLDIDEFVVEAGPKVGSSVNFDNRNAFVHLARKIIGRSRPFGEDYSFCVKARRAGKEIWCDPSFELCHYGDYKYGIRDFIYQQKRGTLELVDSSEGGSANAGGS